MACKYYQELKIIIKVKGLGPFILDPEGLPHC
jgi:hypothetical protein